MLKGKTVLVAEDDSAMQTFLIGLLKREFNCDNILVFRHGDKALDALKSKELKKTIDLILCDWMMPGNSGDEILLYVRQDKEICDLPFIMLTSKSDKESLEKVAKLGVDDYLVKPFSTADLDNRIKKILAQKKKIGQKRFNKTTALSVNIICGKDTGIFQGAVYAISFEKCLIRTPFFKYALFDKVELQINFINETIHMKAEICGVKPDREDRESKSHMMVELKITEIDEENKKRLGLVLK